MRKEIKALRAAMGWTQNDLARIFNVGLETVKKWENGKRVYMPSAKRQKFLHDFMKEAGLE